MEKLTSGNLESGMAKTMAENLNLYYSFLEENKYREAMAHFANLFNSTAFPNALAFVVSDCGNLFDRITAFIAALR